MRADNTPYSVQYLKTLARTLKVHRSLLWVDPRTNSLSIKQLPHQEGVQARA